MPNPHPVHKFPPGHTFGGRKRTEPLTTELKRLLKTRPAPLEPHRVTAVAEAMLAAAEGGDVQAARLIFEYVEGKPVQRVTVDIRTEAERLAAARGLDVAEILRTAEAIAAGHG